MDYCPSQAASAAFTRCLDTMAMRTYRELPGMKEKRDYARGFAMGFDGLAFPVEAIENGAMTDGYMFGSRAIHKGVKQGEGDPAVTTSHSKG